MGLRVAVQMDPMESLAIAGDSTFAVMLEAQARGHGLFHYLPRDMGLRDGVPFARGHQVSVRRVAGDHFSFGPEERVALGSFDVILLRQDPPFDLTYITTTHFLDAIHPRTLVVNDPAAVRNAPEKLLVTRFPDLTPPTLITADRREILDFRAEHGDIIVKPLFGNGGAGVFRIRPDDTNLNSLLETFAAISREPVIAQKYLPAVRIGDKRIILVDGEPAGAVLRVPAAHETRANLHVGGRPDQTELTAREREICARIGPYLRDHGLLFVGIDVIGDYLTEINVTSPTGLQEIARLDGVHIEKLIWDAIERRHAATRS